MEHKTTVVEFALEPTKLFEIVQGWAQKWKFSTYEKQENRVIYYKRIRLTKAWLSVENKEGKEKIEAWIAPPNVGPDFEGNAWKGWKVALPQGFSFGPQLIYRKTFNDLLKQIAEKYPNTIFDESVNNGSSSGKESSKPTLAPILSAYGIFLIVIGVFSLLTSVPLIYNGAFLDLATEILISSTLNIVIGSLIFASSRLMIKSKVLAIWLYSLSMLIEISGRLIKGEKLNYLFIFFGIYALWNIYQEIKRQTVPVLAATD